MSVSHSLTPPHGISTLTLASMDLRYLSAEEAGPTGQVVEVVWSHGLDVDRQDRAGGGGGWTW